MFSKHILLWHSPIPNFVQKSVATRTDKENWNCFLISAVSLHHAYLCCIWDNVFPILQELLRSFLSWDPFDQSQRVTVGRHFQHLCTGTQRKEKLASCCRLDEVDVCRNKLSNICIPTVIVDIWRINLPLFFSRGSFKAQMLLEYPRHRHFLVHQISSSCMGSPQQTVIATAHRALICLYVYCRLDFGLLHRVLVPSICRRRKRVQYFWMVTAPRMTSLFLLLGAETCIPNVRAVSWVTPPLIHVGFWCWLYLLFSVFLRLLYIISYDSHLGWPLNVTHFFLDVFEVTKM